MMLICRCLLCIYNTHLFIILSSYRSSLFGKRKKDIFGSEILLLKQFDAEHQVVPFHSFLPWFSFSTISIVSIQSAAFKFPAVWRGKFMTCFASGFTSGNHLLGMRVEKIKNVECFFLKFIIRYVHIKEMKGK